MLTASFVFSLLLLFYIFIGYPLLLKRLTITKVTSANVGRCSHTITAVIIVYNEERHIGKKITNILNLDYPEDQLNILVVDDGTESVDTNLDDAVA